MRLGWAGCDWKEVGGLFDIGVYNGVGGVQ